MELQGKTIGACYGRFDLMHYGHVNMLRWCKSQVDRLIVGIASDDYCKSHGGAFNSWRDRADVVKAMKYVDAVFCYYSHDLISLWRETEGVDVMFLNDEIKSGVTRIDSIPKLKKLVKVSWIPRTPGVSTSGIIERIRRTA
jgi:cytidyltransferase-like protein